MQRFLRGGALAGILLIFAASCGSAPPAEGGQAKAAAVTDTSGNQPGAAMSRTADGMEIAFRYVPAGSFQRDMYGKNIASITRGYWIAELETTQELFQAVMGGYNPSYFRSAVAGEDGTPGKLPVENLTWYDAVEFCNKLNELDGKQPVYTIANRTPETGYPIMSADVTEDVTREGYRLPTELEWLWAAMGAAEGGAGVTTTGWDKTFSGGKDRGKGSGSDAMRNSAWYGFPPTLTHKAGTKFANELGVYDMSGNVWELCWDYYVNRPSEDHQADWPDGPLTDYRGQAEGNPGKDYAHAARGGAYGSWPAFLWLRYRAEYSVKNMNNKIDAAVAETQGSQTGFRVIYREAAEP
jgi:formylglycine-generating enzyme required for sulfatase activity